MNDESDHVAFFQMPGMIVALCDRGKLAQDSCVVDPGGWGGVTLAYTTRSPEEVDSGVFVDLDGHPWEVAHNPRWTVREDGSTTLD